MATIIPPVQGEEVVYEEDGVGPVVPSGEEGSDPEDQEAREGKEQAREGQERDGSGHPGQRTEPPDSTS